MANATKKNVARTAVAQEEIEERGPQVPHYKFCAAWQGFDIDPDTGDLTPLFAEDNKTPLINTVEDLAKYLGMQPQSAYARASTIRNAEADSGKHFPLRDLPRSDSSRISGDKLASLMEKLAAASVSEKPVERVTINRAAVQQQTARRGRPAGARR